MTTSTLTIDATFEQFAAIRSMCVGRVGSQTPEIHYRSAEPSGFGVYDESSVWTLDACTTENNVDFTMKYSRMFGTTKIDTILNYTMSTNTTVTVTSNCTGKIAEAWGAKATPEAAKYVCANAEAALRAWAERHDNVGSVPATFTKHGNNGTSSCNVFCDSHGGTEWVGVDWSGGAGRCVGAVRQDTNPPQAIGCGTTPGYLGGPELTCECANAEVKTGNNGTASCSDFCAGPQWGGFTGTCAGGYDRNTRRSIGCAEAPGHLGDFACACMRSFRLPHFPPHFPPGFPLR